MIQGIFIDLKFIQKDFPPFDDNNDIILYYSTREGGDIGLFNKLVPKYHNSNFGDYRMINLVYHHWGRTSIYWPLSNSLTSLVIITLFYLFNSAYIPDMQLLSGFNF